MRTLAIAVALAAAAVTSSGLMSAQAAPAQAQAPAATSAHAFSFEGLTGGAIPLSAYKGKVVLVVNTASKCGFTPQYEGLQKLYDARKGQDFVIVGVPSGDFGGQELGSSKEIAQFCKLNYGVTFPMATKNHVVGADAHPFYKWALASFGPSTEPKWNFHKILIGKDGKVVAAFGSRTTPDSPELAAAIAKAQAGA
ncbi:MAG: glutathione peroxidase [Alphaproteobacteria bacterium]|nr:glutathione peroxidase [Alphaproteobacteria bacterium]